MALAQNILITGGAGFIGSNFIPFFLESNPLVKVFNLDNLTYAGNLKNLAELNNHKRYHFIEGNICDTTLVNQIFEKYKINGVIHFAAESHVDNSIKNPGNFIKTNIEGVFVLLEAAKENWFIKDKPKEGYENARFHHISTDEVYGSLTDEGFFTEETSYAPNSPYSASKANEPIPIYGDGKNVRDWLYVLDHCKGIAKIFESGKAGETYVMGGDNAHNNLYIAHSICAILDSEKPKNTGSYSDQITFVKDRLGHDYRYAIDASKIKKELKWTPLESFDSGLHKTIQWYLKKYQTE